MDCVVPHYTQTCGAACPHHQQDDVELTDINPDGTSAFIGKCFLKPATHSGQIASLQTLIGRMKESARYFIHGFNTCNTERYHRERLKLTPKALEFWKTWAPRCALNQVYHNCGYAETHRLVLAKLGESILWAPWIMGIEPGNRYLGAMDAERAYHSARKSKPAYNRREDQLAREFGKRRAAHDRTSQCRGHGYQHSPPLYSGNVSEEGGTTRRKPRRSKEQIEQEKAQQKAEKERLKALFDGGDVTFTTLGVVDVNLGMKGKGRKKKREKGEETAAAGKENRESDQAAPAPSKKRRSRGTQETPTVVTMAEETTPTAARPDSSVVRAILFR